MGGFVGGAISTGTLRGAIRGGLFGAISAGVANGIAHGPGMENFWSSSFGGPLGGKVALSIAHRITQGGIAALRGGKFGAGFLSAFAGKLSGFYTKNMGRLGKLTTSVMVGGTVSRIVSGKFANGAVTAAFVTMFNDWKEKMVNAAVFQVGVAKGVNSYGRSLYRAGRQIYRRSFGAFLDPNDAENAGYETIAFGKFAKDYLINQYTRDITNQYAIDALEEQLSTPFGRGHLVGRSLANIFVSVRISPYLAPLGVGGDLFHL